MADAGVLSPDAAFDRQWALTVVARALEALRLRMRRGGARGFFRAGQTVAHRRCRAWRPGGAGGRLRHERQRAEGCVHRLKRRFRQLLKAEVAGTLDDPALVEAEMRDLFAALGG